VKLLLEGMHAKL